MAYLKPEDAVDEYRNISRRVFNDWKIRFNHKVRKKNDAGDEEENIESTSGVFTDIDLERMRKDPEFYHEQYDRLAYEIKFARQLMQKGFDRKKTPWFLNGRENQPVMTGDMWPSWTKAGAGLAAMWPDEKRDAEGNREVIYKPWNDEGSRSSWIRVSEDKISIGGLTDREMADTNLVRALIRYGKSLSPASENALLAQQQLGIQRWGDIKLNGNEKYLRNSLTVAVKYGNWQHIINPELQGRISEMVRNESNADEIWKKFSDIPLKPDVPALDLNNTLADAHNIVISNLQRALKQGTLKLPPKDRLDIDSLIENLRRFTSESKGDFLNSLIANKLGLDGNSQNYEDLFSRVSEILKDNPQLEEKVRNEIAERAAMRNAIDVSAEIGAGSVTSGDISMEDAVPKPISPILAVSGLDENSPHDMQEALQSVDAETLPAEAKVKLEKAIDRVNEIIMPVNPETEGWQTPKTTLARLERENLKNPPIATELAELGVRSEKPAPDYADPDHADAVMHERYVFEDVIGDYGNLDKTVIYPQDSDNSYLLSKYRWPVGGTDEYRDFLVIMPQGENIPLAMIYHDDARGKDIIVGCPKHPGVDNTELEFIAREIGSNPRRQYSRQQLEQISEFSPRELPRQTPSPAPVERMAETAARNASGIERSQEMEDKIRQEMEKNARKASLKS